MEQNAIQINGVIAKNVDVRVKNVIYVKKIMFGILLQNGKELTSIKNDSAIICDEIVNVKETNFNEKNITCKIQNFYILLALLLITIALLIAVTVYCYLTKF